MAKAPCPADHHAAATSWSLLPVLIAVILLVQRWPVPSAWQGFSLLGGRRPTGLPPARRRDPRGDVADLQAVDHHDARSRCRSARCSRSASTGGTGARARRRTSRCCCRSWSPRSSSGSSLYILFTNLAQASIQLGTNAQLLGLIAFQISYPVIIVRARLLSIGNRIRGGRDGPRRDAGPGDPTGAAADAVPGDPRERRAGVRGRRGRLRHGRCALRRLEQRDAGEKIYARHAPHPPPRSTRRPR